MHPSSRENAILRSESNLSRTESSASVGENASSSYQSTQERRVKCCGFLFPTFQLPWSTQPGLRPISSFASFSTEAALERFREAAQMNINARIIWYALHALFISYVVFGRTDLQLAIKDNHYWYWGPYLLMVLITVAQYHYTAGSSPGYVQDIMAELNSINNLETGSSSLSTRFQSPAMGRSASWQALDPSPSATLSPSALIRDSLRAPQPLILPPSAASEQQPLLPAKAAQPPVPPLENGSTGSAWRPAIFASPMVRGSASSPQLRMGDRKLRCSYCHIWQPLRSKHCHDCDKCVLRFDHHCFWVGTCVGQKNHRRFWWYLFFQMVLTFWTLCIAAMGYHWKDTPLAWIYENALVIIVCTPLLFLFMFLASLVTFHTWLVITNQTTYETSRKKRIHYLRNIPPDVFPFSRGTCANISDFCLRSANEYPTYVLPPLTELNERAANRTWFRNEYYRCCQ